MKVLVVVGHVAYESSTVIGVAASRGVAEDIEIEARRAGRSFDSYGFEEFEVREARKAIVRWDEGAPDESLRAYRFFDAETDEYLGGGSEDLASALSEAIRSGFDVVDVVKRAAR